MKSGWWHRSGQLQKPKAGVACGVIAGAGCVGAIVLVVMFVGALLMTLNVI
jgi:hypothetical protein